MSINPAPSQDDSNVVELSESPGRRLRVQRQSRGLEIERVATQLHLRPPIVEAIEQDRFDALPSPVFAVGYLRNYARLLGLDPDPLIATYRALAPAQEPTPPRPMVAPGNEMGSGHLLVRAISLALLGAVIALVVLWWQNRADLLPELGSATAPADLPLAPPNRSPQADAETKPPSESPETPVVKPTSPSAKDTESPNQASPTPPPAPALETPATAAPVRDGPDIPVPTPAAMPDGGGSPAGTASPAAGAIPAAPPPQPSDVRVELRFSGPCWIDVRDSSGKVVLSGEMSKGDSRRLDGNPPYSFVIGNAGATTISIDGKTLDLSRRAKGNVARFKLDPNAPD
jgi:cytoskeleton protein RodZ